MCGCGHMSLQMFQMLIYLIHFVALFFCRYFEGGHQNTSGSTQCASAAIQSGNDLINCYKSKNESKISMSSNALHRRCWLAAGSKLFVCFSTVVGLKAALCGTS